MLRIDRRLCFELEAHKPFHRREVGELQHHLDAAMIFAPNLTLAQRDQRLTRRQVRARHLVEHAVALRARSEATSDRASYSARGRNNEGGGDDAGTVVPRSPVGRQPFITWPCGTIHNALSVIRSLMRALLNWPRREQFPGRPFVILFEQYRID